jgi:hypothetical protein
MSIQAAQSYLTRFGWGAQGKSLGITRMFQEADVAVLKSLKAVAALRPRGVLSGFLVIAPPSSQHPTPVCAFVPPVTGKQQPFVIRMRLADSLQKEGAIFSAYSDNGDLVIEDVLVWRGKALFSSAGFEERWRRVGEMLELWEPDAVLQGCGIRFSEYMALAALQEPAEREVVEFVPLNPNMKRMVWVPTEEAAKAMTQWIAKRESLVGPDIFSLWSDKGEKQPHLGLVRTLGISKMLRLHPVDEFRVNAAWNKMFERWEILGIA